MAESRPPALLCTANFPSGTGYAWDFIESLYAGVADRLARAGVKTYVAYPGLEASASPLEGSAAVPIERAFRPGSRGATKAAVALVRELGIQALYMADRPSWSLAYPALRRAGVRAIIVHDHTSGARTPPRGLKRLAKRTRQRVPGSLADRVIAVSDFVARRNITVDLIPQDRVTRVWNSVEIEPRVSRSETTPRFLAEELQVDPARPFVLCACRASPHKGVDHAMRAFDRVAARAGSSTRPVFVHAGEGPYLPELERIRQGLGYGDDVYLLGYRSDVRRLIDAATVCLAPSTWAEGFGLSALEPMARGRAVVASAVGGLPEVVVDGETGILVPPGDEVALADAICRVLGEESTRSKMEFAGRERAESLFERGAQLDRLTEMLGYHFQTPKRA